MIFASVNVCFDLGTSGVMMKKKRENEALVKLHGGEISLMINKKTTHFVTTQEVMVTSTLKVRNAEMQGIFIVLEDYIHDSIRLNQLLSPWPYMFVEGKPTSELSYNLEEMRDSGAHPLYCGAYAAECNPRSLLQDAISHLYSVCYELGATEPSGTFNISEFVGNFTAKLTRGSPVLRRDEHTTLPSLKHTPFSRDSASHHDTASIITSRSATTHTSATRPTTSSYSHTKPTSSFASSYFKKPSSFASSSHDTSSTTPAPIPTPKRTVAVIEERAAKREEEKRLRAEAAQKVQEEKAQAKAALLVQRESKDKEQREQRAQKIAAERQKRGELLEKLKRNDPIVTTMQDFFSSLDIDSKAKVQQDEFEQWHLQQDAERKAAEDKVNQHERELERAREMKNQKLEAEALARQNLVEFRRSEKDQRKVAYNEWKAMEDFRIAAEKAATQKRREEEYAVRQARREARARLGIVVEVPKTSDDRKIFVGGLDFQDFEKKKMDPVKLNALKEERAKILLSVFNRFGKIEKTKLFLEKKHLFITFENASSAKEAFTKLQPFEDRKTICEELKVQFAKAAPLPNFYVREVNVNPKLAGQRRKKIPAPGEETNNGVESPAA